MFFETRIQIIDQNGKGRNLDLSLLVYDAQNRAWRDLTSLLTTTDAELRRSRREGNHIFRANIEQLDKIFSFESLPYIRITQASDKASDEMPQFIDVVANIRQSDKGISLDFGTALFLGDAHGFVTGSQDQPYFCQGVSAPLDRTKLSALSRLYYNPGILSELDATLSACQQKRKRLETELKARDSQVSNLESDLKSVSAELNRANSKIESQDTSIATLTTNQAALQKELKDCQTTSKQKDKDLKVFAKTQMQLEAKVEATEQDKAELQTQLNEAKATNDDVIKELDASRADAADIEGSYNRLREEHAACEEKLIALQAELEASRIQSVTFRGEIKDRDDTIIALNEALLALEASLVQYKNDSAVLKTALENSEKMISGQAQELVQKDALINSLEEELTDSQKDGEALADDKINLVASLQLCSKNKTALEASLAQTKQSETHAKAKAMQLSTDLALCKKAQETSEQDLVKEKEATQRLTDQVKELEAVTTELAASIQTQNLTDTEWKNQTRELRIALATQTAKAEVKEKQLGQVREQIKQSVKTEDVITSIGLDASRAAKTLREKGLPYKLGRLHLNMKTIMMPDGKSLYLPDAAVSATDTALTEIDIELLPDEESNGDHSDELSCPNLLGLTQTAVISNLAAFGLKHQSSIAAVSNEKEHGRAIRQIPEAGETVVPGTIIRVIYGQNSHRGVL